MTKKFNILYLHPSGFYGLPSFMISFIRISNYLNLRKKELSGTIEEEYIDLRFENLPEYLPENLKIYRKRLKIVLKGLYERIKFNIVAITCYTSFNYINSVEVAFFIKKYINPACIIVIGGVHPTILPQDFQPRQFPEFLYETYSYNITPFDFLIRDEGEIPFFKLIQGLLNETIELREKSTNPCIILKSEMIKDLNELPIINLKLFKKYKSAIESNNNFYIDFSRGCPFKCETCPSKKYIKSYKTVRFKAIEKCIEEIKVIKETFSLENLIIVDMIFFPNRTLRERFFNEMQKFIEEEGNLPFQIHINERIEICSMDDLRYYKKNNIIPSIGLESGSKILLYRIGKVFGKNEMEIKNRIKNYLQKFEDIVKEGNILDLPIIFFYLVGAPGSDEKTISESEDYFLKPRIDGKSLIEKYKINLMLAKYIAYIGSEIFYNSESKYGSKIYFKKWWKIFDKDQLFYAGLIDPSKNFTLIDSLNRNEIFYIKLYKNQTALGNHYYFLKLFGKKKIKEKIIELYTKVNSNLNSID